MPRVSSPQSKQAGLSPGALVHIGERRADRARITVLEYDDTVYSCRELQELSSADECRAFPHRKTVRWVNVDGVHSPETMEALGKAFGVHALVLEDAMNTGQRPKVEDYDDSLFVVLKMLDVDKDAAQIVVEQVSIVLGADFVVTFQERAGDVFDGVRDRIKNARGKIRRHGADYLAYALIDAVVDHYFIAVDWLADLVERADHDVSDRPHAVDVRDLYVLRREALFLRKMVLPAREAAATLMRMEPSALIRKSSRVFFRDVHDHTQQVTETVEGLREVLQSILDVYHAAQANRMNEIMKVLTVFSTIFMPLTFVVGIYGMNFEHMPELRWHMGYPLVMGLMALIAGGMVVYFKRRKWL